MARSTPAWATSRSTSTTTTARSRCLRDHGIEYVERVLPDYGYRQVFFRDPDGNVLELGEWPPVNEMFPEQKECTVDGR